MSALPRKRTSAGRDFLALCHGCRKEVEKLPIGAVYATLVSSGEQGDSTVISEMLRQLELITQSRRARLVASEGAVPSLLRLVLLGGARGRARPAQWPSPPGKATGFSLDLP
jgi:hypothetical protein